MVDFEAGRYRHAFSPGTIHYGQGCIDELGATLEANGWERALVLCGSNVAASTELMDPVETSLGDRLVTTFTGSAPGKPIEAAYECAAVIEAEDIDVMVAIGGGSTFDLGRIVRALASLDRPQSKIESEIEETGTLALPDGPVFPGIFVPTTLAGSEQSVVGGARGTPEYPGQPDEERDGGCVIIDERLMSDALFYDPALFRTTPDSILASSAMNGFNKAIEALYSRHADPITDATAVHGLRLLGAGLPDLVPVAESTTLEAVINGVVLAQHGVSVPDAYKISIVHAFGHGFSTNYDVQQGDVHGILTPPVLEYVFENVDGRRRCIADGLGIDAAEYDADGLAAAIVERVRELRDHLRLPSKLRTIDGLQREHLPGIATEISGDRFLRENSCVGLDPSADEIERALRAAW